jgi:hypothetical protein
MEICGVELLDMGYPKKTFFLLFMYISCSGLLPGFWLLSGKVGWAFCTFYLNGMKWPGNITVLPQRNILILSCSIQHSSLICLEMGLPHHAHDRDP